MVDDEADADTEYASNNRDQEIRNIGHDSQVSHVKVKVCLKTDPMTEAYSEFDKPITADLVQAMVQVEFPQWKHLVVRPVAVSGWDNRSFRMGEDMLVRVPSAARYVAQVEKEQRWLPYLASRLSLQIPRPLALGRPCLNYPWPWSVYEWIEGDAVSQSNNLDQSRLANDLAEFLRALQKIDVSEAPIPGPHNFYRGGNLRVYDEESRSAIAALTGRIDTNAASAVWNEALSTQWRDAPVWVHGDMSDGNLLVRNGRLAAVIDFGSMAVGDPACDFYPAWTFLSQEARNIFRSALNPDPATWNRGRGWALWKGLITLASDTPSKAATQWAESIITSVLQDAAAQ
jgi:aminoglycoside phosphotransferase (APT) family kinase protein